MFGVDFSEIALIFLIALVVLGPAKLPQVAATIGRWIGRARVMARQFREQLEQEADEINRNANLGARPAAPRPATPPATPAPVTPAAATPAPAAESTPHVAGAATADGTPAAENLAPASDAPPLHAEHLPAHLDHPAPLPAEPHERGA
jgi:sec-independent protein translocase protein TatB